MELRKLQYFESVARNSSFTKAADELHVAQPTITAAIKRMEAELGVPLFVRDTRKVMLTYEGQLFLQKVTDILQRIDQAVTDMQERAFDAEWKINLGVVPISGSRLLSILYKDFFTQNPRVHYQLLELGTYGIMEAIDAGEIDLGFVILRDEMLSRYETCPIYKSEMKVLVNLHNPLACRPALTIQDLADQDLIYFPEHSFVRQRMDLAFRLHGVTPRILVQPVQMVTIYSLVQRNAGISFSIGDFYNEMIDCRDVVAIPLAEPIYCESGFVWKKGASLNIAARKCLQYILDHREKW